MTGQSAKSIRQDTMDGDDEGDVNFGSQASGVSASSQAESETSSMRTEITDSEPES